MDQEYAVLQRYCENDMRLLKKISESVFKKFGEPISKADYADFYSIANQTLWQAYNVYNADMGISFDAFLRSCLKKKFSTEIRGRHRQKRIVKRFCVSLESAGGNEDSCSFLDFLPSDCDTFEEAVGRQGHEQYTDKVQKFISRLSGRQVNILNLLTDGYKPGEIQRILGISVKKYTDEMKAIRSYENIKILL